jgi:AcrR family transcriptional regulator
MTVDSKKQILQTALKLFLRNSYKEVSLKDIVKAVGLTKGAFYHYYTSKEQLFEEVVRYFYNNAIITNYSNFPKTSLKEFYEHFLAVLQEPDSFEAVEEEGINLFTFFTEAYKRVPDFLELYIAQQKKEIWAWAEIIEIAKRNREIRTSVKNEELAAIFLSVNDGVFWVNHAIMEKMGKSIEIVKRDLDNIYDMLKTNRK